MLAGCEDAYVREEFIRRLEQIREHEARRKEVNDYGDWISREYDSEGNLSSENTNERGDAQTGRAETSEMLLQRIVEIGQEISDSDEQIDDLLRGHEELVQERRRIRDELAARGVVIPADPNQLHELHNPRQFTGRLGTPIRYDPSA